MLEVILFETPTFEIPDSANLPLYEVNKNLVRFQFESVVKEDGITFFLQFFSLFSDTLSFLLAASLLVFVITSLFSDSIHPTLIFNKKASSSLPSASNKLFVEVYSANCRLSLRSLSRIFK